MSCAPPYSFRPDFVPGEQKCDTPLFEEHRSRSGVIVDPTFVPIPMDPDTLRGLFVRSREQGYENNDITVEISPLQFTVRFQGVIVETYANSGGLNPIDDLRTALDAATSIVEMPAFHFDIFDNERTSESMDFFTAGPQNLQGGSGGPIDAVMLAAVRTGPERSIVIITTTEDLDGSPITPPSPRHVRQWNGFRWVEYNNLVPGNCPFVGTS